jgi:histidyl-tRNA synthetase
VFEAFDRKGAHRAIAGGGRYDDLVKLVSGGKVDLPALGFGMGDVVLTLLLRERGLLGQQAAGVEAFCLIEDEALRPDSLRFIQDLRDQGFSVEYSLTPAKSDKQFKRATETGAVFAVRLERNPAGELVARLKNVRTRQEQVVSLPEVRDKLATELGR